MFRITGLYDSNRKILTLSISAALKLASKSISSTNSIHFEKTEPHNDSNFALNVKRKTHFDNHGSNNNLTNNSKNNNRNNNKLNNNSNNNNKKI